ncbi:GntR family transcriptional regulator [Colwellia psychrerythraea]|uniref:Transcriptional regulator, GntR family with FCD sensor domain containing protein n=1 Tax=Colwellia psychrerythraea TaxID=28229 RepID=A0A099KPE8_COLPS|nr:GntR family transcriptional regulator [Colwellia psychrerythraea]KGJ92599.1 transcriptional regulator, GntR family with FCD sensor domain containing protein [Colwellia psychrerythraea]
MNVQSYLIQETVNGILTEISDFQEGEMLVLKDNTLAKKLKVSRTTIRTAITELETKGIVEINGSHKQVLRSPNSSDYFDTSNSVSSKEEIIEKYFLDLINRGKLLPGDKFSELELAKSSGCNTITVREFLIKFSRFGLIEKSPRAKWQMVKFDEKFALELVEFRRILEMNSITQLLAVPEGDAVWSELSELLDKHLAVLEDVENRYTELSELDRKFHFIVQRASDNRFFMQFFDVVSLICHYHYQWNKGDELERNKVALEEHVEIITQLLAHNTSGVIIAMETHLNTAKKTLLRSAHGLE